MSTTRRVDRAKSTKRKKYRRNKSEIIFNTCGTIFVGLATVSVLIYHSKRHGFGVSIHHSTDTMILCLAMLGVAYGLTLACWKLICTIFPHQRGLITEG